jgi:citrate/tricarballylate utilization protein
MSRIDALAEADRQITICNACRYCEGLCPVFPALQQYRHFSHDNIHYFANLCHQCGACEYDCQFASPHEFAVDIPRALARVRSETYTEHVWPRFAAPLLRHNGVAIALIAALAVALFILGFVATAAPSVLWTAQRGPGAFYRVMPHGAMVLLFGGVFLYAILALAIGVRRFYRASGGAPLRRSDLVAAAREAATLRHLDGGDAGCHDIGEATGDRRRLYHHLSFYGFLACLASTSIATLYHFAWGRIAPYPWYDLPVVLGTLGGIGIVVGPLGLLAMRWRADPVLRDESTTGMDVAFLLMLALTGATGLALLVLRETAAMGMLLALHLGIVFALFLTMPYGKFVHGFYRFAALLRSVQERRSTK